jgi:hypothetical protein
MSGIESSIMPFVSTIGFGGIVPYGDGLYNWHSQAKEIERKVAESK